MNSQRRVIFASAFGNALEFYDFTLYGVFAPVIAKLFFPSTDPMVSLISSWGAFAAGFLMRPFGAIVFGFIGDRFGRKKALTISLLLMGLPTLVIGLLPSYESIGLFAPLILICCRLLQGLCTGGEYNGAAIYALEHLSGGSRGFAGGVITGSCVVGALMATFLGSIVTNATMPEWAWRLPFVYGSLVCLLGFYIRKALDESPEFTSWKQEPSDQRWSFTQVLKTTKSAMFMTFIIGCLNGILSYTLFGFMNVYLSQYTGIPLQQAMHLNIPGLLTFMTFSAVFGLVMDKLGATRYYRFAITYLLLVALPIYFLAQSGSTPLILLSQIMLGLATASIAGPQHAFVQRLFPVPARYLGISVSFCAGMALCGGTTPMVLTYLINKTQNLYLPGFYLMALTTLFAFTLALLKLRFYDGVTVTGPKGSQTSYSQQTV